MATLLDATILQGFAGVFSFLIVFVMLYGVLSLNGKIKLGSGLSAIISFCIAIFTLFSPKVIAIIRLVTPWYVSFFFLILIIIIGTSFFGGMSFEGGMGKGFMVVITVICVLIFLFGWLTVSRSNLADNSALEDGNQKVTHTLDKNGNSIPIVREPTLADTLLTPALLGVLAFLIIGAVAIIAVTM